VRSIKATALQRYKDTFKDDGAVLPAMERHVMRQLSEKGSDLTSDHMHPSEMAKPDWCGRHDYYRIVGTPTEKHGQANPSFKMSNVWAEGHTIHEKYQRWLHEMGCLYGEFRCRDCEKHFTGLSPTHCIYCKSERLIYREIHLHRQGMLVEGHTDGAVHDLDGWSGLIEIKSIGIQTLRFEAPRLYNLYQDENMSLEDIWWRINRPFGSHLKQGQWYLWLAWPRYEHICFIYESKFHQATKEFVVSYNPQLIAPQLEIARAVTEAVRDQTPPDRPVWAEEPESRICKSCEFRNTCWGIGEVNGEPEEAKVSIKIQRAKPGVRKRGLSAAGVRPA
jgi:hypothetical protein